MIRLLWIPALISLFAGCGSSPARFYTLMPANEPIAARGPVGEGNPVIVVGPVTIPASLDQPQLVVASGNHELEILEQHRWAAPLKDEIASALAARLARLIGDATVAAHAQSVSVDPDVRIVVDISRFELRPKDRAVFEALWTIKTHDKQATRRGRTNLVIPVTDSDYSGLAIAQGRALDAVAQDIAALLRAR